MKSRKPAVGPQHNCLKIIISTPVPCLEASQDGVPQEALAPRVHAGGGLVQQHDARAAHHGQREGELAARAARALLRVLARVLHYLQPGQVRVHYPEGHQLR